MEKRSRQRVADGEAQPGLRALKESEEKEITYDLDQNVPAGR